MPTLIGRFNELLHQLSSSSSSGTTSSSTHTNATTTNNPTVDSPDSQQQPPQQKNHSRQPPRRSHSNRIPPVSQPQHQSQSQKLLELHTGNRRVKRSSSTNVSSRGGTDSRVPSSSSSNHHYSQHHGQQTVKGHDEHRSRNSRSGSGSKEGGNNHHHNSKNLNNYHQQHQSRSSSSSGKSRVPSSVVVESSSRREHPVTSTSHRNNNTKQSSSAHSSRHHHQARSSQQQTNNSNSIRRRNSIASIADISSNQLGSHQSSSVCPPNQKKQVPMTKTAKNSATKSSNINDIFLQMAYKTTKLTKKPSNDHQQQLPQPALPITTQPILVVEKNNNPAVSNNNESTLKSTVMNNNNNKAAPSFQTSAPNVLTTTTTTTTANINEESLASRLARKMKILDAITHRPPKIVEANSEHRIAAKKQFSKLAASNKKNNQPDDSDRSFLYRYLNGNLAKKHPDIIFGKTCYDLPVKDIECLENDVVAACTGPNGGLLNVKALSRPFDLPEVDVDFIDEDYADSSLSSAGDLSMSPLHRYHQASPSSAATKLSNNSSSAEALTTDENEINTSSYGIKITSQTTCQTSIQGDPVAGIIDWNRSTEYAYGISTSLYESHPSTKKNAGDPIADSFGLCVRENSAIIALGDGVNWGDKACLASRCAVHGCIDYLNKALYSSGDSTRTRNTMDVFVALLRSFNAAHHLILSQGGQLTTLCAAVICQLKNSNRFIVCTCNVGDSFAYVYSPLYGVREITQGSHDIFSMRDMRDALGALGPVSGGSEPELNNLTVAMTVCDPGDIVFLTSDGISDNFDPVVGKFAKPKKEDALVEEANNNNNANCGDKTDSHQSTNKSNNKANKQTKARKAVQRSNSNPEKSSLRKANFTANGLPLVSGQQRHELTLLRMEDLITNGVNDVVDGQANRKSAKELCSLMVDFSTQLTMAKRRILEDPELYTDDEDTFLQQCTDESLFDRQRQRRRRVGPKLAQVPGKLDHASIAAVEVNFYGRTGLKKAASYRNKLVHQSMKASPRHDPLTRHSSHDDPRYNLKLKATLARFESQDSLDCCCNEAGPI